MWRAIALQDRAQQRQRAQISARAERRYALSQTSAPILTDTRACKRVGPQGQSIYENCALAGDGVVVGAH